jgi:hypothetical protein
MFRKSRSPENSAVNSPFRNIFAENLENLIFKLGKYLEQVRPEKRAILWAYYKTFV